MRGALINWVHDPPGLVAQVTRTGQGGSGRLAGPLGYAFARSFGERRPWVARLSRPGATLLFRCFSLSQNPLPLASAKSP